MKLEPMEYNINCYKNLAIETFMLKSKEELKKLFNTERICWALVVWTYQSFLGTRIENENELIKLGKRFRKIKEYEQPKFPDIVIFKNTIFCNVYIGRHVGIMLNDIEFIHAGFGFDGLQITRINRSPWTEIPYIVIRHENNNN